MSRSRTGLLVSLGAGAAALLLSGSAAASGAGGADPDASAGSGGVAYGAALRRRPVATRFSVSPARLRADRAPRVVLRVDQPGFGSVRVRLVARPVRGGRLAVVQVGTVRTGRSVRVAWPASTRLAPGRYRVTAHAVDPQGLTLLRPAARALTVVAAPKPKPAPVVPPAPAPAAPAPAPAAATPVTGSGVFPVAGAHTYGDGIGEPRSGHTHQGQDVVAAEGTPVVAPLAGTIRSVAYQPSAAGWYVVEDAADGRSFFFAHCRTNSVAVTAGQTVVAGAQLCAVGHTGDASGPHLHFEIWEGGWRVNAASHWIDPLAQLRAWDH